MKDYSKATIEDVKTIAIASYVEENGVLSVYDFAPFPIKRVFQVRGVTDPEEARGKHAHFACHQILIASAGQLTVTVSDGFGGKEEFYLNANEEAIHIPPGLWAEEHYLTSASALTVLCSHGYCKADYMNDWVSFEEWKES
jgi:hypothetical protein